MRKLQLPLYLQPYESVLVTLSDCRDTLYTYDSMHTDWHRYRIELH